MKSLTKRVAIAAFAFGISGAVRAQSQMQMHQGMDPAAMQKMMQDMMPAANDPASTKEFKQAHMKMMHDMHVTFSGNADVDFVRGMIPHHQGAIDMAKIQLKHGKTPELRKMAEKMIKDQEKEISDMQAWLKKNAR